MIELGPLHCKPMKAYDIEPVCSRSHRATRVITVDSAISIQVHQGIGRAKGKVYLDFGTSLT